MSNFIALTLLNAAICLVLPRVLTYNWSQWRDRVQKDRTSIASRRENVKIGTVESVRG